MCLNTGSLTSKGDVEGCRIFPVIEPAYICEAVGVGVSGELVDSLFATL